MKRCYIAGMISNLSKEEFTANFERGKRLVKKAGMVPVSPLELNHDKDVERNDFLKTDLKALLDCHAILLLIDWQKSNGALLEYNTAINVGLTVYVEFKYSNSDKHGFSEFREHY